METQMVFLLLTMMLSISMERGYIKSRVAMALVTPPINPYYTITTTVPSYITSGGLVPTHPSSVTLQKQRFINGSGVFTKTTTFTYNNKAKVLAQTEFSGLPKAVTTNFTYNGFGNLIGQSVAAQNMPTRTESYAYDDKQRFVISQSVPCSSCPGSPTLTEIMNYDPFWGKVTYKKDAQCQQFSNSYDAFGRLSSTTDNYGITSTYSYNWVTGISNQLSRTTIVTPNKPFIQKGYDILGRETATYSQNKDGQTIRSFITYNNKGQKVGETNTHYFSETPLYTNYSYDSYNRLSQVQNFQGTTSTAYEYPAGTKTLKATTTFPDGRTKVQITDATGAIQSVEDGGGLLSYEYNANNEVIVTKKDGISVLSNSYDDYGRINQTIDPNAGTINYEYNAFGDLYRQTDNSGNLTETQYDGLGRTTAIISSEGTIEYEYGVHNVYIPPHITLPGFPPVPGTYCPTQVLTKITGYNGFEQTFTYNDRLRPIIKYETIDGQTYGTFYNYALNGDLLQTTYPSGVSVQNIYNSFGFLTEKKDQNNNSLYQLLATNGMRQATQFKLGNNLTSSISYTNGFPQSYNTAGVQSLQFDFNFASGNLSMRRDLIKNKEEIFTFDHLNRLVSAQVAGQSLINYHYDLPSAQSLGNISAKKDVGNYKYEPNRINAVSSIQNATLTSLPPQNISTDDQRITYTSLQRPATIEEGDYSYELTYAPENERIKTEKRFQGETVETRYYFEGCELIITPNGSKWVTYVNGANGLASMIVTENNIHKNYFTYTDHLGSILTVTNAAGIVVAEQNFDAWGARRDPNTWISLPPQAGYVVDWLSRGYTGHEHLSEFALINMNARLYDPIVGRMLSADNYVSDMFSSQAYNRYTYANNNPLKYTDPTGEIVWAPIIIGAVVGAYMGGTMANNGNFNPTQWDYNSGRTWGWMAGGAIVGGISGGIGGAISTSGVPMANTLGIMSSSLTNSIGTHIYTGGQTDISMSFGVGSFNFSTGELGYLGKKGNSALANIGYGFGALANLQDIVAGFHGTVNETRAEHGDGILHARSRGEYVDATGTTQNYDISVAHVNDGIYKYPLVPGDPGYNGLLENLDYARYWGTHLDDGMYYSGAAAGWKATIYNVNSKAMGSMYGNIKGGLSLGGGSALKYGYPWGGCYGQVARALFRAGVPTVPFYGFTPHGLVMQLWLRQAGIYASPLLINR